MAGILKVDQYQDFNGNNIMTSDGSGNVTVNAAAMKNTPAFQAKVSSNFSVAHNTNVVMPADNELIDTDSKYDTSTYRFTPSAGKYYLFANSTFQNFSADKVAYLSLRKNGSAIATFTNGTGVQDDVSNFVGYIEEANGTDYFDAVVLQTSGSTQTATSGCFFGAYKLIGA
tara:strand:+ start:376 stop:888 length:513 start_codon:yes stop_codon:yes gene_type:complete